MRVTALVENSRIEDRNDLQPEFGLSMYIEHGGTTILFDMGTTSAFASNASAMRCDLGEVDAAVVSHQHFDHGGGLEHFLELNHRATVYLRDASRADRWFKALVVLKRPIGLDPRVLDRFDDRIEYVAETREIASGVFLITDIGSAHLRPRGNQRLFVEVDGAFTPDPFDHELMMVVQESDGMVIFTGCSHHGVLNMIDAAVSHFPNVPIKAVIGGFHLIGLPFYDSMAASRAEVQAIGRNIMDRVEGKVFTGHCTGEKAYRVLEGVMGDTLQYFATGTRVQV